MPLDYKRPLAHISGFFGLRHTADDVPRQRPDDLRLASVIRGEHNQNEFRAVRQFDIGSQGGAA